REWHDFWIACADMPAATALKRCIPMGRIVVGFAFSLQVGCSDRSFRDATGDAISDPDCEPGAHLGATVCKGGGTSFGVWAPNAATVSVIVDGNAHRLAQVEGRDGIFALYVSDAQAGSR